ncbi:M23 family metallopeptidase [Massilia niastensis]|uniref:M23 family metallopeptidase n=1 Tax=Massilia niastensis TaxID=544911 RepID=UPI000476655D|nr:M23 family metallopeptidase [Massilia niastensis]
MKRLMIFVVGLLVGAGVLFVLLNDVADEPAPAQVAAVDTAAVAAAPPPDAAPPPADAAPADAAPPAPPAGTPPPVDAQLQGAPVVPTNLAEADLPLRPTADALSAARATPGAVSTLPTRLLVPVQGVKAAGLTDTFDKPRGNQRHHEALDIMAPKGTPVLAAGDGKVVKLFESKPGGLTVYQFDPSEKYAYYYAHLDRYADGVKEGMTLKRGDLVGYVGVSGNSDPNAPHLHFALVELTPEKEWWKGTPLNPFPLLTD